jgi:hypothetical protein
MSFFVVDVESDGPIPFKYSMVCFGAILVEPSLGRTFYGETKPISDKWEPEALAISGISREQHLFFEDPLATMTSFKLWIEKNTKGRPIFVSDNLAYDWQWINWYFHWFLGENPFGYSGRRIPDLFCGMHKDAYMKWKHLRKTKHTHMPVDDAKGNAEIMLEMQKMGLKIRLD